MDFYKCLSCGEEFDQPDLRREYDDHTELTGMRRREWDIYICPYCSSDYIEEGWRCQWCNDRWTALDFCDECLDIAGDAYKEMLREFGRRYDHSEKLAKEIIEEWVEDHW